MPVKFKPLPWLSLITLIFCAILLTLGTWQYKRMHWKADLLVAINSAANAPPLTSLSETKRILEQGEPLDFRRIELNGSFVVPSVNDGKAFHLMRSNGKKYYWRLYQPYLDGEQYGYIASRSFDEGTKDNPPKEITNRDPVVGYVRIVQKPNMFTPKSTPAKNRWFAFNGAPDVIDWADAIAGASIETRFFIDQDFSVASADQLPARIPEIANNHLDYMLTWYSFVIILLVIYAIIHFRAGRLSFRKSA